MTYPLEPDAPNRCTAKSTRTGERCKRKTIPGGKVCVMHGGKAPQVQRKARLRLLELVDPAIATLAREMTNQNAKPTERLKAADSILDRAGWGRTQKIEGSDAREALLQKLLEMQADGSQAIDEDVPEGHPDHYATQPELTSEDPDDDE